MSETRNHTGCFRYRTHPALQVERRVQVCEGRAKLEHLTSQLDRFRGLRLTCAMEYPGRYQKKNVAFINPPLMITSTQSTLTVEALNQRGKVLMPAIEAVLSPHVCRLRNEPAVLHCEVPPQSAHDIIEEQRSKTAGVVPLLKHMLALFQHPGESMLGLYGAFAYDMAFQFDAIERHLSRDSQQRDLQFYLPDEVLTVDPVSGAGHLYQYDFIVTDASGRMETTGGLRRETAKQVPAILTANPGGMEIIKERNEDMSAGSIDSSVDHDHSAADYQNVVKSALSEIAKGNLFEVVPSRTFTQPMRKKPSAVFQQLLLENPSPYAALINLGAGEFLVTASPEMFVRVNDKRVESCPISGTIKRGKTAIEDAEQIKRLLNSHKDEVELTMCTDVDRNDKNRVCEAGSVRLLGRRQVEMYSRLIHTVDHVEGQLRDDLDGLDALMSHCWAVTVTGAPKRSAMSFIEQHEQSARGWYGGCFGFLSANGDVDTGLTIRTIHVSNGLARVRAGATLLAHSSPAEEEAETRLKASALLSMLALEPHSRGAIDQSASQDGERFAEPTEKAYEGRVLVVDHEDSFIHSLSAAFRALGMTVETRRPVAAREALTVNDYDLVVMSPGPGTPEDFSCHDTLALCELKGVPVFGVCLGMQAMVTYCGGALSVLPRPVHGSASQVCHHGDRLFTDIEPVFRAGRYHSLMASKVPDMLEVTSRTLADGIPMSVRHQTLPWVAVQFHPESILSGTEDVLADGNGFAQQLVRNLLSHLHKPGVAGMVREGRAMLHARGDAIRHGAA